jgi:hypothetical protein
MSHATFQWCARNFVRFAIYKVVAAHMQMLCKMLPLSSILIIGVSKEFLERSPWLFNL